MKWHGGLGVAVVAAAMWTATAVAAVPTTSHVQALVQSAGGQAVPDGKYAVQFALFKDASGGQPVWQEPAQTLTVTGGLLHAVLGASSPLAPALAQAPGWIEVTVLPDPPLPRQPVAATLAAMRSAVAEAVDCSGCIGAAQLDPKVFADLVKSGALAKVASTGAYADL